MGAMIDLLGSYIVKIAIVGIILTATVAMNGTMIEKSQQTYLEQNVFTTSAILESDLKLAGYNVSGTAMQTATATDLQFTADLQNDGSTDVVRYTVQSSGVVDGSGAVRYALIRTVNGASVPIGQRLISVAFAYRDSVGNTTATLARIRSIQTTIVAESSVIVDGAALTATRAFIVYPVNL